MEANPDVSPDVVEFEELPQVFLRVVRGEVAVEDLAEVLSLQPAHGLAPVDVGPQAVQAGQRPAVAIAGHRTPGSRHRPALRENNILYFIFRVDFCIPALLGEPGTQRGRILSSCLDTPSNLYISLC